MLLDVQEAKRYTFTYGLGLEFQTGQPTAVGTNEAKGQTGVSPRGSLAVTRLNLWGRNHTITFKADVGSLQQRGLISYAAPRLFGSPNWNFSVTGFYDNTLDVTTFTSQRLEGSVQTREIINKTSTLDYSFTYRRVKASNIQISPADIPLLSLPVRVGEPGLSYIRNTRDNDLESTKGSYNAVIARSGLQLLRFGSRFQPASASGLHLPRLRQEPASGKEVRDCALDAGWGGERLWQHVDPAAGASVPRPDADQLSGGHRHSAGRTFPGGRRKLTPRIRTESGRAARSGYRLSAGRECIVS